MRYLNSTRGIHRLFHVSYFYIPAMGFMMCIAVGLIVSAITGWSTDTDPALLNPYIAKYYKKKEVSKVEMNGVANEGKKVYYITSV